MCLKDMINDGDWISVDKKLPDINDSCWIRVEYINMDTQKKRVCYYQGDYKKEGFWLCTNTPYIPNNAIRVTHWILRKCAK